MKKDLLSIADLSAAEIAALLASARGLKADRRPSAELAGRTLGMIFQKPSTRTAVSFSVGMFELGGHAIAMNAQDLQMKRGESMADTARTLSRYVSGIMIRANQHAEVEELARSATVPVISGLTDKEHPCQILGDLVTMMEVFKLSDARALREHRVAYIGDGNNVTQSWMMAAGVLGLDLVVCTPEGYRPEKAYIERAEALCRDSGGRVAYELDPVRAATGAAVLYTDVWASMGKDDEREQRKKDFAPYQINAKLLALARKDAVVMHCLPAHRGEEIAEDVIDGPRSVVFEEAENRLHIQKAILLRFLKGR